MGELAIIRELRNRSPLHPWVRVGPGDDCAVLAWDSDYELVYKMDQIVEGTHFLLEGRGAGTPDEVGWKAMAKAASDIAAMGCWPVAATVAVTLAPHRTDEFALALHGGLSRCAAEFKFGLVGGDISTGSGPLGIAVSMIGRGLARKSEAGSSLWLRSGAQLGDDLLVTGPLGGSGIDHRHLTFRPRLEEAKQIQKLLGSGVHACIDITDGLSRDLRHICEESRCGAILEEASVPVSDAARQAAAQDGRTPLDHVLGDGEDFELLVAVDPSCTERLLTHWQDSRPPVRIGRIVPKDEGLALRKPDGTRVDLPDSGWEHKTASDKENGHA